MTSDLLSPSGPHPSLRRTTPSTVYRVAPDALPKRVRRGADGKLYGEVPLIPVPHDEGDQGVRNTRGGELDRQPPRSTAVPDLDGHDTRPDPWPPLRQRSLWRPCGSSAAGRAPLPTGRCSRTAATGALPPRSTLH